jgi:hypothetical protein
MAVSYISFKDENLDYAEELLEHATTLYNFGKEFRGLYSD